MDAATTNENVADVFEMTVPCLREELRRRGLRRTGKKQELQGRLVCAYLNNTPKSPAAPGDPVVELPKKKPATAQGAKARARALSLDDLEKVVGFERDRINIAASGRGRSKGRGGVGQASRGRGGRNTGGRAGVSAHLMPMSNYQQNAFASLSAQFKPGAGTVAGVPTSSLPKVNTQPNLSAAAPRPPSSVVGTQQSSHYFWEWQNYPGPFNENTTWQPWDETISNQLTALYRTMQRPEYRPLNLTFQLREGDVPTPFSVDVKTMFLKNLQTGELRALRCLSKTERPLQVPPQHFARTYRLQFRGYPQHLALSAVQFHKNTTPDSVLIQWISAKIDEENNRAMSAAMDESKKLHEVESERNRQRDKKRKLEQAPMDNPQYNNSNFLRQLRSNQLFSMWAKDSSVYAILVEFLDFEAKCLKWYPSSAKYFTNSGIEINQKGNGSFTAAASKKLCKMIESKLNAVRKALTQIPSSAAPGFIPKLFWDDEQQASATNGMKVTTVPQGSGTAEMIVLE